MGLFAKYPQREWVITGSRGPGELHDAVVQLMNGGVDLSPVFQQMEKDNYYVHLRRITSKDTVKSSPVLASVAISWAHKKPFVVAIPGIESGLYHVNLVDLSSQEPLGLEAWALVRESAKYTQATRIFQEAVAVTDAWKEKLESESIRGFLRASLALLADSERTGALSENLKRGTQ